MEFEKEDCYRDLQGIHDKCKRCMYYHTKMTLTDGRTFDGIIENVDPDRIIILVGEDVISKETDNHQDEYRAYPVYGPGPIRYRRFVRQAFPLASLAALSLLPYPYIAPPVPYPLYPYYPY